MKRRILWGIVAALVLVSAGLFIWYQRVNSSASPEVRRLAAVRPTVPPPLPAEPETPITVEFEESQPAPPAPVAAPVVVAPKAPKLPPGVTAIESIRKTPADFFGKEVTVLGTVRKAVYGEGITDCAFIYELEDPGSRAWVLPYHRPTPDLGRLARVKVKVVEKSDRPLAKSQEDCFYLVEESWAYEK
jgi:hypothetical protein